MYFATNSIYCSCEMTSSTTPAPSTQTTEADSISATLDLIGDRWSLLVLRGIFRGLTKFSDLRDDLGIASNLLTSRLKALVDNGVLEKVEYCERPKRYEYLLSPAGRELSGVLVSLMQWGDQHLNNGERPVVLVHAECNQPIANVTICSQCNIEVPSTSIRRMAQG